MSVLTGQVSLRIQSSRTASFRRFKCITAEASCVRQLPSQIYPLLSDCILSYLAEENQFWIFPLSIMANASAMGGPPPALLAYLRANSIKSKGFLSTEMFVIVCLHRSSKPPQPVNTAAATASTTQHPGPVSPSDLGQLSQPQHTKQQTQPHPCPTQCSGGRTHHTWVSAAAGQLGAQQ